MIKAFIDMISAIENPFTWAFYLGVLGATFTAIGASIREHHVQQEELLVLIGGCINGMAASFFNMLLLRQCTLKICQNHSLQGKFLCGGFLLITSLIAPEVGNVILKSDTKWSQILVDEIIGASIIGTLSVGLVKIFEALKHNAPPISPATTVPPHTFVKLEPIEELDEGEELDTRSACSAN